MKSIIKSIALATALLPLTSQAQERSVIRVNSAIQTYNPGQPWDKTAPSNRRGLAAYVGENQVLTTAELVANAAYIELESVDGTAKIPAKVAYIDYEANLALLTTAKTDDKAKLAKIVKTIGIAKGSKIGAEVEVLQVESSGVALKTKGVVRGVEVVSSFVPGNFFLTYEIKASMQSASSSFTIPVFESGKLLGLLTSYNSGDQLLDVIAPEIITSFLEDAKDGKYEGFPTIGLKTNKTTDPAFRAWLKMSDDMGGLYITGSRRNSPAAKAGIKKGDVLLAIDGNALDRQGYFQSKKYGKLHWSHLIRAEHKMGETVKLEILRDGKKQEVSAELKAIPEGLIPSHMLDKAPKFLVKGGLIFQELTGGYLQVFGKDWRSRAPLSLLDAYNHPEDYEKDRKRVVFLSAVIPTPVTVGYERLNSLVVNKVNGKPIKDVASLIEAFNHPKDGLHKIEVADDPKVIYLSADGADQIDKALLKQGLPALSRP